MGKSNIFEGRRILVLEDDYWVVMDLINDLRESGAEIVGPFANIDQAMDALKDGATLDGAILDVNVQGDRSFTLADALIREDIPFVFATGYDSSEIPETYADATVLQKPVNAAQIAKVLLR
jgi:two-component SAPR family response regulator